MDFLYLKIANIVEDKATISLIRNYIKELLISDKDLKKDENKIILETYQHLNKNNNIWDYIS